MGRNLYVTLWVRSIMDPSEPRSAWPQTDGKRHQSGIAHQTSTEFFKWAVTSDVMGFDFSFFTGPGMAVNNTQIPDTFTADQNAWCIVANVDTNTTESMPVLFTRNIAVTNTSEFTGPIRNSFTITPKLKLNGVVVVMNGGASWVISGDLLDRTWEEVLGSRPKGDHPVLRP